MDLFSCLCKRHDILSVKTITKAILHLKISWQSECILCDNIINFKDKLRHHEQSGNSVTMYIAKA